MKMALVALPPVEEIKVVPPTSQKPSKGFASGRCKALVLLSVFLMAIVVFVAISLIVRQTNVAVRQTKVAVGEPAGTALQSQWRVAQYDASRTLKRGDNIVVRRRDISGVWRVAASLNDSVVLNRGDTTEGFYMVGDNSYVVTREQETRVVRANDVLAVVEPR